MITLQSRSVWRYSGAGKHPASEPDGADAERKRKKYTDLGGQYLEV